MSDLRAAIEEGIRLALEWKPRPLCGSRENPHLVDPRPKRFPRCVTCGAGWADDALVADMESRGIDTSDILGIDGKPHPKKKTTP